MMLLGSKKRVKRAICGIAACAVMVSSLHVAPANSVREETMAGTYYSGTVMVSAAQNNGINRLIKCNPKMPFICKNRGTAVIHTAQRGSAPIVPMCLSNKKIDITGRVRNESNNLWLEWGDKKYIWADYLSFDFDTIAKRARNDVKGNIANIYKYFKTGAKYDLKQQEKLGCATYNYSVTIRGKELKKKYTGEALGNILYGYICAKSGLTLKATLIAPCLADTNCTDKKDNENIMRGYVYGKIGLWCC